MPRSLMNTHKQILLFIYKTCVNKQVTKAITIIKLQTPALLHLNRYRSNLFLSLRMCQNYEHSRNKAFKYLTKLKLRSDRTSNKQCLEEAKHLAIEVDFNFLFIKKQVFGDLLERISILFYLNKSYEILFIHPQNDYIYNY